MTSSEAYTNIKALLDANGYREIPDLVEIDEVKESHADHGYILQPIGSVEDNYTNNALLTEHNWRLEITYRYKDSPDRVTKYGYFHTIKTSINDLSGHKGFISEPTFKRLANLTKISVGTLEFSLGLEGS